MTVVRLLILGVVIGSNNLAAGLALGALGQAARARRVVLVFGAFEFFVPLVGLAIGRASTRWIEPQAAWVSVALLAVVGLWMVWGSLRQKDTDERLARRATTWGGLVVLAAGLSIDNLVVGFGLGLRAYDPVSIAATIAAFSMLFAWVGIRIGDVSRRHWERTAGVIAGVLLIVVAGMEAVGVI